MTRRVHQDRQLRVFPLEYLRNFQTVELRHLVIEDDSIERKISSQFQRFTPIRRRNGAISDGRQKHVQHLQNIGRVVYAQNRFGAGC